MTKPDRDIDEILCYGSEEEIRNAVCADCGKPIEYMYSEVSRTLRITCPTCMTMTRITGCNKPNCVKYNSKTA